MWGEILGAAANAAANWLGGERQQEHTMDNMQWSANFNADEAAKNREWQERMSNTSWQRSTADMQAAGINPMLAFMKGGASTPPGGQGSSSPGAGPQYHLGAAEGATAVSAASLRDKEQQVADAEIDLKRGQTQVANETVTLVIEQASQTAAFRALNESQKDQVIQAIKNAILEGYEIAARTHRWSTVAAHDIASAGQAHAATAEHQARTINLQADTALREAQRILTQWETRHTSIRSALSELDLPKAQNEAKAQSTWWKTNVTPYLSDVGHVVGAASSAATAAAAARFATRGLGAGQGLKYPGTNIRRD